MATGGALHAAEGTCEVDFCDCGGVTSASACDQGRVEVSRVVLLDGFAVAQFGGVGDERGAWRYS